MHGDHDPVSQSRSSAMRRSTDLLGLVGWLLLAFAAGAVGAWASLDAARFYAQLARPWWAPPVGVFGPVWTTLYLLMGVAAWWVWRSARGPRTAALGLFVVQLAANALWSWLFFGWHLGRWAAIEVLVLLGLIAATVAAFWRVRPAAAALMLPYLVWVAFACALTWAVWRANPSVL